MQVRALTADCYHTTAIEQWFSILGPEYTYLYVVLKHTPTHTYIYKLKRHQLAAQCHLETLTCHIKMCHVTFLPPSHQRCVAPSLITMATEDKLLQSCLHLKASH